MGSWLTSWTLPRNLHSKATCRQECWEADQPCMGTCQTQHWLLFSGIASCERWTSQRSLFGQLCPREGKQRWRKVGRDPGGPGVCWQEALCPRSFFFCDSHLDMLRVESMKVQKSARKQEKSQPTVKAFILSCSRPLLVGHLHTVIHLTDCRGRLLGPRQRPRPHPSSGAVRE